MSFFNPEIPLKQRERSQHPWEHLIKAKYSGTYKYGHNSAKNPIYPAPKRKDISNENRIKFTVVGNRVTKEFIYCFYLVKYLHRHRQKQFEAPVIRGLTSVEWPKIWNDLKIQFGNLAYCLKSQVAIWVNDELLGGEDELKALIESKYVYHLHLDYYKEGVQQFANYIHYYGRPCAYLHISINDKPIGTLIFMLYSDIVPRTCQNFLQMCEAIRGGYGGSPIHRIVADCWIQGGGFGLKSAAELSCENFIISHDRRGVLCMANDGRNVDCSTQFFVLLQPAPWMEDKYVAFGQLIEGEKTLERIESVPTWYESPMDNIIIYKAGVFNIDCSRIPINKNTHEYIQGHIENLVTIGEIYYELILEKVFGEILNRRRQRIVNEEEIVQDNYRSSIRVTEKMDEMHTQPKKELATRLISPVRSSTPANKDFDVEVYEYEAEEYQYDTNLVPSTVEVLEKPFYLPLTDIPYPGEIESTFDLKKLLRGDYCLESDLDKEGTQKKLSKGPRKRILAELAVILYDYFEHDDDKPVAEQILDSYEQYAITDYIKATMDEVSLGGTVVTKMAGEHKKFEIFDDIEVRSKKLDVLTDEELRLYRMAMKEYNEIRSNEKRVTISTSTRKMFPNKIKRRQTGLLSRSDIEHLFMVDVEEGDEEDLGMASSEFNHARDKIVSISTSSQNVRPSKIRRRQTGFLSKTDMERYRVDEEENDEYGKDDKNEQLGAASLPHDKPVTSKISSNSFDITKKSNTVTEKSLRILEYAKVRPTISVMEYKMKNQKYQAELKASLTKKPTTESVVQ